MRRRGAFARNDKPILIGIEANWDAAAADEDNLRWARDLYAELSERSRDGAYLNFAGFGEEERNSCGRPSARTTTSSRR